jgi:hypothetical protein
VTGFEPATITYHPSNPRWLPCSSALPLSYRPHKLVETIDATLCDTATDASPRYARLCQSPKLVTADRNCTGGEYLSSPRSHSAGRFKVARFYRAATVINIYPCKHYPKVHVLQGFPVFKT